MKVAASGAVGELARARIALDERGQRLGELEERTALMMSSAENFSKHAHEVRVPPALFIFPLQFWFRLRIDKNNLTLFVSLLLLASNLDSISKVFSSCLCFTSSALKRNLQTFCFPYKGPMTIDKTLKTNLYRNLPRSKFLNALC